MGASLHVWRLFVPVTAYYACCLERIGSQVDVRNNRRDTTGASVITANRLLDGRTVWLTQQGWSEHIAHARIFDNANVEDAIKQTKATPDARKLVGIYGVQLDPSAAGISPLTMRERIRAFGPSVHPDFAPVEISHVH